MQSRRSVITETGTEKYGHRGTAMGSTSNPSSRQEDLMEIEKEPRIFVTGTSRSGTGLFFQMLGRSMNFQMIPETHYFDGIRTTYDDPTAQLNSKQLPDVHRYFGNLARVRFGHGEVTSEDEALGASLRELIDNPEQASLDDYFKAHCHRMALESGVPIWGEKTPRHCFRIREILETFPGTRVVHMLRDPRAVMASYKNWHKRDRELIRTAETEDAVAKEAARAKASYNPILNSLIWKSATNAALGAAERFGSDRVRIITYESLCTDPLDTFGDFAEWMGFERPTTLPELIVTNSSYEKDNAGGVTLRSFDRWKSSLTRHEIRICEMVAGDTLAAAGYERTLQSSNMLMNSISLGRSFPGIAKSVYVNRHRMGNPVSYIKARVGPMLKKS